MYLPLGRNPSVSTIANNPSVRVVLLGDRLRYLLSSSSSSSLTCSVFLLSVTSTSRFVLVLSLLKFSPPVCCSNSSKKSCPLSTPPFADEACICDPPGKIQLVPAGRSLWVFKTIEIGDAPGKFSEDDLPSISPLDSPTSSTSSHNSVLVRFLHAALPSSSTNGLKCRWASNSCVVGRLLRSFCRHNFIMDRNDLDHIFTSSPSLYVSKFGGSS
mmetsp:Transcript_12964/g.18579  ORF Transcript_12964/g.18579 Transcript_12964/m.18579 type:complete len:214 (+) Transcript_12964:162-803(+)